MRYLKNFLLFIVIVLVTIFLITFGIVYWGVSSSNIQYQDLIEKNSLENKVDPYLVAAVINTESHYKSDAVSSAGAKGLMQLMPETADWLSDRMKLEHKEEKLFDPDYNIKLGSYYLKYLINYYKNTDMAILAYNAGQGNVDNWIETGLIDYNKKSLEKVPFGESRDYVNKVNDQYELYKIIYKSEYKGSNFKISLEIYKEMINSFIRNI